MRAFPFLPGRVAVVVMLAAVAATHAEAQTGLLIVTRGDSGWTERARNIVSEVEWTSGPKTLLVLSGRDPAQWRAAIADRLRQGGHPSVVMPLLRALEGEDRSVQAALPREHHIGLISIAVALAVVDSAALPAALPARRIEIRADLAASDLVPGPRMRTDLTGSAVRVRDLNVTATRDARTGFDTPMAVTVLGEQLIRERHPNTAADLFLEVPGLDLDGVGTTQRQPIIRGLQGQRILLLEDGLRLNNSRRSQDRGEIPALVDVAGLERVEIVRGASSVLYGSDAVGGVINLITRRSSSPPSGEGSVVHGELSYRYSTVDNQSRPAATLSGRSGPLSVDLTASYRSSDPYDAPGGEFGRVSLRGDTPVLDTGVEDYALSAHLGYRLSRRHDAFIEYDRYSAEDAGFGFVDPSLLGDGLSTIQILFPSQRFTRFTAGFRASELGLGPFDRAEVSTYLQDNEREFQTNVFSPFPAPAPPDAGVSIQSRNFTDIRTFGFRAEFQKLVRGRHLVTYGIDLYRDDSRNTDTTITTVLGAGPPTPTVRNAPRLPDATFRSLGGFLQWALSLGPRLEVILGGRYQDVQAQTRGTPGLTDPLFTDTDRNLVGSANVLYRVTDQLSLMGSVGRAFRSPNLVERFFNGPSPEGRGFWIRNLDLKAETSLHTEAGLRFRSGAVHVEGFVFRNAIHDAIRTVPTGNEIDGATEFQNVNIDELRVVGLELGANVQVWRGLSVNAGFTHVSPTNVTEEDQPFGDGYSHKLTGTVRYASSDGRYWLAYTVRHNGRREDVELGTSPVGDAIPAFTVHAVHGGLSVGQQRIGISVTNLTNALYAEAPNVGFFRPEPKRNVTFTWAVGF